MGPGSGGRGAGGWVTRSLQGTCGIPADQKTPTPTPPRPRPRPVLRGRRWSGAEGSGRSGRLGARSPQAAGRCQRGPRQPRFHPAGPGLATRHGHSQQHGQTQAGGPAGPGRLRARRPPPVFRRFLPICFPLPSTRPGVATNRLKQITIISPRSPFFFTLGASASHADILSPGKAGRSGPSGCLPGGQGRGSHGPCVALPGPR